MSLLGAALAGCSPAEGNQEKDRAAGAARRVRPAMEQALTAAGLHWGDPVFLRAFKKEAVLEAHVRDRVSGKYRLFRTWPIAAQSGRPGPKEKEGDGQVPEGFYATGRKGMKPDSAYHLAFNIGYPNACDLALGRTGSFIMVHGGALSIGCLAMTDPGIEEIYTLCDAALTGGQPFFRIHIFPFRMTPEAMAAEQAHPWIATWQNLKEGYDWFEKEGTPPDVTQEAGRYLFRPIPQP